MADLFGDYELLARSGLFDAEYYVSANPDVMALNIDPLLHYLEKGAGELRNPSDLFDARYYSRICELRGEHVDNPLLHFIKYGATQGLATHPGGGSGHAVAPIKSTRAAVPVVPLEFLLDLDQVLFEPGSGAGRLIGLGWCLSEIPIIELAVSLGSVKTRARYGLPRVDVAQEYPQYLKSDHSGFEFNLGPIQDNQLGMVELEFTVILDQGDVTTKSVPIDLIAIRAQTQHLEATTSADYKNTGIRQSPLQLCVDLAEVDVTGVLHIVGWAVCLAPILSVQVLIDGKNFAAAEYGNSREDVALSHPQYPNARHSGFALHADVTSHGDGDHIVKVQAIASTGITRETVLPFTFVAKGRELVPDRNAIGSVQYFCDVIEITHGGQVSISGWAVASTPPSRISVLLDDQDIGDADIGIERPDVGNQFPGLAHARKSGFSFHHTVPEIRSGEHLVVLRYVGAGNDIKIQLPVLAVPDRAITAAENQPQLSESSELILSIDLPQLVDGSVVAPIRNNLEIAGWTLARSGIESIDISIDGLRVKTASTGIRRSDVQRAFPTWEGALTAGFSTLLPQRSMLRGPHNVSIVVKDKAGQTETSDFRIVVEDAPDADGPWALRRNMPLSEAELLSRPLFNKRKRPSFAIVLVMPIGVEAVEQTRLTLMTLATQIYDNWRVHIITRSRSSADLRRALLSGFPELLSRVDVLVNPAALKAKLTTGPLATHIMVLRPGDELGCDALLEFAAHGDMSPQSDFLYCDARALNKSSGQVQAFFKPNWSPDLLHSQNYLGRAWCASVELLQRAEISAVELARSGIYHVVLRLTEHARAIMHVPAILLQENSAYTEEPISERKALEGAVVRLKIVGTVKPGRVPGTFRVRRKISTQAVVSIIIPTCGARGLIRKCIETIRNLTTYLAYEIVCIENIPEERQEWKVWVRANADRVIETSETFNWSRFNNRAAAMSRGEFLLFLNDDIEIVDPHWLDVLIENAARRDIGVIGPQLLYPDRRVQHAGMFLAGMGVARHAFRHGAEDDPGYFGLALTQREVISVTGACLMTRRDTFEAAGGFDETHDVVNNDVDYCLRVWRSGLRTIYTPHTTLIHHELASRSEIADHYDVGGFERTWRSIFADGDPYFHPRLAKDRDDYSFEWEPVEIHCVGYPLFRPDTIRRILIVKLDHIGDCVTALPAIRKLKRHFPAAKLYVLTGRASRAVWALEAVVDEIIEFDFFNARSASGLVEHSDEDWRMLRARLSRHRFDLAIDLRKHWETRPVLRFTEARYLAGFDMKGKFPWLDVALEWSEDSALLRKRQHTTDDLVNLVDAVAAAGESDRRVIDTAPFVLSSGQLKNMPLLRRIFRKRVVCVHASVGNEMRQWPAEYFSLLIDQLLEDSAINVILIGGPDEEAVGAKVLDAVVARRSVWSLIGKVKLSELPGVISSCALFVGNNSGPHHIAAGLGVPTVGIHSGVVDAREWGPKGRTAIAIDRVMTCAPCYLSKPEECGRGLACLRGLLPADVVRLCRRLLAISGSDSNSSRRCAKPDNRRNVHCGGKNGIK